VWHEGRADHGWARSSDESMLLQKVLLLLPPLESWIGVHVDGPSARVVEGGPRGWGRASLAAMALVALVRSNGTALLPRSWP
jgi:hypothetical protein